MILPFHNIDPVAFSIGPLPIRWYSLAYIGGLTIGWWYAAELLKKAGLWPAGKAVAAAPKVSAAAGAANGPPASLPIGGAPLSRAQLDDLIFWVAAGVMLGGRLGYILFYEPRLLVAPWPSLGAGMAEGLVKTIFGWIHIPPALMLWEGGMSFHGGILGVTLAGVLFARRNGLNALQIGDLFACATPIGLFFGRLANFINGELYGRPWNGSWAMIFPHDPLQVPRHPSQLYEAALEGLVLFAVVTFAAWRLKWLQRPGAVMGLFLVGYGLSRVVVENFREPDAQMPDFPLGLTMGMILSLPMLALGAYFLRRAFRKTAADGQMSASATS
ncbi:MAG: prolipoprotein diacylglyceryl transferase [Parvularculaceae bacterium]|nr:prolipoprotein diacylglyceryl transferase [Parvularculaceae bacterium]